MAGRAKYRKTPARLGSRICKQTMLHIIALSCASPCFLDQQLRVSLPWHMAHGPRPTTLNPAAPLSYPWK
jgi:hypothetical protein